MRGPLIPYEDLTGSVGTYIARAGKLGVAGLGSMCPSHDLKKQSTAGFWQILFG